MRDRARHIEESSRIDACVCMHVCTCVCDQTRTCHALAQGMCWRKTRMRDNARECERMRDNARQCEIHTEESVCMSIDSCVCMHVCTCACMHVCPYVCTHVCTHVRIYIHTRACVYTHVRAYVLCIHTHRVHSATFEFERLTVHLCHSLLATAHPIVILCSAAAHTNLYV